MYRLNKHNSAIISVVIMIMSVIVKFLIPSQPVIHLGVTVALVISYYSSNIVTISISAGGIFAIVVMNTRTFGDLEYVLGIYILSLMQVVIISVLIVYLKGAKGRLEHKIAARTSALSQTMERLNQQMQVIKNKDDELSKLNKFLASITQEAGAMIIATTENGTISFFNKEAERELGYTAEELIGKSSPEIFHDKEETRVRTAQLSEELKIPLEPGFETYVAKARLNLRDEHEWTYIRKDGKKFPVNLYVTPLSNGNGEISGYLGIVTDISERKKAEADLTLALGKEKELGEMKSRFISLASHEFRTPLSTVLSSAYLLKKYQRTEDQPKREFHIHRIVSSVDVLNNILNDFLSVGKIDEGKVTARFAKVNLPKLVQSVIRDMDMLLKAGQEIDYVHEGNEDIITDPALFKDIVINLLSNAIKFSFDNSRITMTSQVDASGILVKVRDEGIGIPHGDQQHLFERFYRCANAVNIQGTGLGLHIVAKYVRMLNGSIECNSEENKGTGFCITIPLQK